MTPKKTEPAKKKVGRPKGSADKITPEAQEQVLERIANGETLVAICKSLGFTPCAIYRATMRDEEFSKRFARAREFGNEVLEDEAIAIADGRLEDYEIFENESDRGVSNSRKTFDNVRRAMLMAETRLKIVARRKGAKLAVSAKVEQKTKTELTEDQKRILDKVLDAEF